LETGILMTAAITLTHEVIAQAESYDGIKAGVVPLKHVLEGFSYQTMAEAQRSANKFERGNIGNWPMMAQTVLVLGLNHPEDNPRLDYWERGNTEGNRRLREISWSLEHRLKERYGLAAIPLAYHLEKGGPFLKDAAVLSGLGVIGKNNLLLNPEWGPRMRLRAMLMEGDFHPTDALTGFDPCETCDVFCQNACPVNAFPGGRFSHQQCSVQMSDDKNTGKHSNPDGLVNYCRMCEFSCPIGA